MKKIDNNIEKNHNSLKNLQLIVSYINVHNYSPFESLIHLYDLCQGIDVDNEIFQKFCNSLNIPNTIVKLRKDDSLGVVNAVYLKDKKYGINGIYYISSLKNTGVASDYLCFAKTKKQTHELLGNTFEDLTFNVTKDDIPMFEECLRNKELPPTEKLASFYIISKILKEKAFSLSYAFDSEEEIIEKIHRYISLMDRPISSITFIKALYEVRKVQAKQNPSEYELTVESLRYIFENSGFSKNGYEKTNKNMFPPYCITMHNRYDEFGEFVKEANLDNESGKKLRQISKISKTTV